MACGSQNRNTAGAKPAPPLPNEMRHTLV